MSKKLPACQVVCVNFYYSSSSSSFLLRFSILVIFPPPSLNVSHLIPSLSAQNASNQPNRGQFSKLSLTIIEKRQFLARTGTNGNFTVSSKQSKKA